MFQMAKRKVKSFQDLLSLSGLHIPASLIPDGQWDFEHLCLIPHFGRSWKLLEGSILKLTLNAISVSPFLNDSLES